jgi:7-carboxy-7-deazaguanine synthase
MRISETFKAIQGEGVTAGLPVYFVRTSGCNTKCDWCDSQYANYGTEIKNDFVVGRIRDSKLKDIVFTGGEPMMQIKDIYEVMQHFHKINFHLETNGSIYDDLVKNFNIIQCSPKKQLTSDLESYKHFSNLPQTYFKFVYEGKDELWFEKFIKDININNSRVWIMSEGATRDNQFKKMPEVMDYCIKNKFNFSPRLHILAYNTRRGV